VKVRKTGFTLVELLVVLAIIGMLVTLLMPSIRMVRRMARETKQKSQFATINMALDAFKHDYGDYPPSLDVDGNGEVYCGAEKLAEALVGKDLLGFHPDSVFLRNGLNLVNSNPNPKVPLYWPGRTYLPANRDGYNDNLEARRGPYIDVATGNVFDLDDLYAPGGVQGGMVGNLDANSFVICDSFPRKKVPNTGKTYRAGTPILYYKANIQSKEFSFSPVTPEGSIYRVNDNMPLIVLGKLPNPDPAADPHELAPNRNPHVFYDRRYKICDEKVPATATGVGSGWPHRADSYILISAGDDGTYGTQDDILNF